MTINNTRVFIYFIGLAVLSIIAHSFYISATVYSNVIIGRDEANFILKSTLDIISATNWNTWINALFQTHGQHVLVGMQLGNLFSYYTLGYVDFQLINILGLLYLAIPTFVILLKEKPDLEKFILLSAIVFPLALSPGHNSCAINAACTGNHYLGLGLSILALYFFTESNTLVKFIIAEIFLTLAVFSSPASLPLLVLAFPTLWLCSPHKKTFCILHLLFFIAIFSVYYWATHRVALAPLGLESSSDYIKAAALIPLTFFRIIGSVTFWSSGVLDSIISILLGLLTTSIGLVFIYRRTKILIASTEVDTVSVFYGMGFIMMLCMIALISLGRFYEFGSTRYVFYACFCLIFLLLFMLNKNPSISLKNKIIIALVFLAFYPLQYYLNRDYIERIREQITACEAQWANVHSACGVMIKHSEATQLLLEAQQQGILPSDLLARKQH